jgi:hypothetical protein
MKYKPLPNDLQVGDKIACPRLGSDPPEVLEVLKVYDDVRVLVCRENGLQAFRPLDITALRDYDYKVVEEGEK